MHKDITEKDFIIKKKRIRILLVLLVGAAAVAGILLWKGHSVDNGKSRMGYEVRSTLEGIVSDKAEKLGAGQISDILKEIPESDGKVAAAFALKKVGCPYSQKYRDSGSYYDCSSLVYYAWKKADVNVSFQGANSAAAEAQGLADDGKTVSLKKAKAGDLIFFSFKRNGRFKNINHVAIYVKDGNVVEAIGKGVVYRKLHYQNSIVLVCRPS